MHGLLQHITLSLLAQQEAAPRGGLGQMLVPFVLMMGILYLIVIRPQGKERKRHESMLGALKRGDEVITSSGLLGSVADIDNQFLTLEIARNVKVKVLKSAISRKFAPEKVEESADKDKAS